MTTIQPTRKRYNRAQNRLLDYRFNIEPNEATLKCSTFLARCICLYLLLGEAHPFKYI